MNVRTITLVIAILSTIATVITTVQGLVPPAWGLVIGAVGAGIYAIVRSLQKVKNGTTFKSLLSTTEAWGAGLVIVASIVSAIAGIVPLQYAGAAAGIAGALLKVARMWQSGTVPVGPGTPVLVLLMLLLLASASAGCRTGQSPWQNVVNGATTIVNCTKTVCAQQTEPVCQQIMGEVLSCVPAIIAGNPGPCLALVQQKNIQVAIADIFCILDSYSSGGVRAPAHLGASANTSDSREAVKKYLDQQKVECRR